MAVSRRQINPDRLANETSPIQYVTENGFSIVRLSEVDGSVVDTASACRFLVRNERGWEREVTVHFEESIVAKIQSRRRSRLLDTSVLWLVCAEKCLATYLWERDDYPAGGRLIISELAADELLLATHWSDRRDD
jgi:hypothetical protein